MIRQTGKSFFVKRKRGGVFKSTIELYQRDDIYCSSRLCTACQEPAPLLSEAPAVLDSIGPHYLVLDTNTLLHHIDFFENQATKDVIVPQTVVQELSKLSLAMRRRLDTIVANRDRRYYIFSNVCHSQTFLSKLQGESDNDYNDRSIRMTAKWYAEHLTGTPVKIILLTNDKANRDLALADGILALSLQDYAARFTTSLELLDLVATDSFVRGPALANFAYEEHLAPNALESGINRGLYSTGTLQISHFNVQEGSIVASNASVPGGQIHIKGRAHLNRSFHGDVVAVELLPLDQWINEIESTISTAADELEDEYAADAAAAPFGSSQEKGQDQSDFNGLQDEEKRAARNLKTAVPTGRVVGIISPGRRQFCGSIEKNSVRKPDDSRVQFVLFFPIDRKVPKIRVRTRQAPELVGKRILVTVDQWDVKSLLPPGRVVGPIGDTFEKSTETEVILIENGIAYGQFAQQVLNDLPALGAGWKASAEEIASRRDLRHLDVCSIDPPGCTDIDDALHLRELENGNYEIGVHIADVTHFVRPDTHMDTEAANRGATVYLVERRIDMLPELLGTDLCSLRANVDRLAFSCIWEITRDATIAAVTFTKSIIHSKASLTYDEAQMRIDNVLLDDPVTRSIRNLNMVAKKLRYKRMERGALTLASPEVRFKLSEDANDPIEAELKEQKDTNALIEEFMLLANVSVAERIFETFPNTSLLRRHPAPPPEKFTQLMDALAALPDSPPLALDIASSKSLAKSLDQCLRVDQPYFNTLLRIMTTRCMLQAMYFCSGMVSPEDFLHYGLAAPMYTHFTSPIRRYSDIIVHRLLAASISPESQNGYTFDKKQLTEQCDFLNRRHYMAQQASRSSVELYTNIFFMRKLHPQETHEQEECADANGIGGAETRRPLAPEFLTEDAYVTRVMKNGVSALIPSYGIEGIVKLNPDEWEYSPTDSAHVNKSKREIQLRLFCKVCVFITAEKSESASGRQRIIISLPGGLENSSRIQANS